MQCGCNAELHSVHGQAQRPGAADWSCAPCCGMQVDLAEVEKAFTTLGASRPQRLLGADRLHEVLTTLGEPMEEAELQEALRLLTGKETLVAAAANQISPKDFACDILGFDYAQPDQSQPT
jgi:hypothetical protein